MPSAVMFGSLPTGVDPTGNNPKPWQTLLFRPGTALAGKPAHPGEKDQPSSGNPSDHLLLDLFWMPVVEPYALSDPFSAAGKVNMNYEIMPYTYITRTTALRAALAGEKVACNLPPGTAAYPGQYKDDQMNSSAPLNYAQMLPVGSPTRLSLNLEETLKQLDAHFAGGDIYHSATDICDIFLVPQGYTYAGFPAQWYSPTGNFALVGDNTREKPYADIYAKLTTKSNTYQVHYRVQSLLKAKTDANQAQWVEGTGQISGEKRGSVLVERYLDVTSSSLPDPTLSPGTTSLEGYYKFRVVGTTVFHP